MNKEKDIFKVIPNFSRYEINQDGSVCRNRFKQPTRPKHYAVKGGINNGYHRRKLINDNGEKKFIKTHRLVALAFLNKPDDKDIVCHRDDNKINNHYKNLYWGTHKENMRDVAKNNIQRGERNGNSKLCENTVRKIKENYKPEYGEISRLAKRYNVGMTAISDIINGRSWNHV